MRITKKVRGKNENCRCQNKKLKINKQTIKERNLSFRSLSHQVGPFTYIQNVMPIVSGKVNSSKNGLAKEVQFFKQGSA